MSSQIKLTATGTVVVDGATYSGPKVYNQLENNKNVDVKLSKGATCELHRVLSGNPGFTRCLRLEAGNGVFSFIKVRARPKLRKNGTEFNDVEMKKCKRNVKVHNNRKKVTYTIHKSKGLLVNDQKIRFSFTAN